MRPRHALHAHMGEPTHCFEPMRYALAIHGLGRVYEIGQQPRKTASVLKPFGSFIHQIVRNRFGIDVIVKTGMPRI
jgi:hypothetical protein